jgi:GT2 family glycosyltransferase
MNIMIILNYNDSDTTLTLLNSIEDYKIIDKIIVVDNCSTDNSYKRLLSRTNKNVDVIKSDKNGGYSYGNNFGVFYAERYYNPKNIIISNPDIKVKEDSIKELVSVLNENNDIALSTGVVKNPIGQVISNFGWKVPTFIDMVIGTFLLSLKIANLMNRSMYFNKNLLNYGEKLFVEAVSGCFFVIKYEVLKNINYFDDETFLYCEENILGYKLKEFGYRSCILCTQDVIHYETSQRKSYKKWKMNQKQLKSSYLIYLNKYLKVTPFQRYMFILLFDIGKYERKFLGWTKSLYENTKR